MAAYSIKDLEKLSGIKAHTIRIWEKRYGLISPARTSTNIRLYCDTDLKKLLNVSLLNRNGIKISKIAELDKQELNEKINHLLNNNNDPDSHLENLILAMIDIDEARFEKVLTKSIIQIGFEETIIKIIYPFFIRIGIMWQTGTITPAQEHFVSNLIRQKIIVAIDSQMPSDKDTHTFLLYLPEGELHELGLLFFAYLIKKRGFNTIYLGQSVPMNDVKSVIEHRHTDSIVTSFVTGLNTKDLNTYTSKLAREFSDKTVYISGALTENLLDFFPSNIKIISSPREFCEILDSLKA